MQLLAFKYVSLGPGRTGDFAQYLSSPAFPTLEVLALSLWASKDSRCSEGSELRWNTGYGGSPYFNIPLTWTRLKGTSLHFLELWAHMFLFPGT